MTDKASENIEVMRKIFRAIEDRDLGTLRVLSGPGVEFHWPPSLPYGRDLRFPEPPDHGTTWVETWLPASADRGRASDGSQVVAATDDEVVVLWNQRGVTAAGDRFDGEVLGLAP